jgi:ABC-type metal ion transport system substrate-binding protein
MKLALLVVLLVVCTVAQKSANEAEKAIVKILTTGPSASLIEYVQVLNKNHYSLDKVLLYAPKIEALIPGLVQ